jgi:phospholipid/cholesterol/gamma-HCH transport system substrate-binding protein
VNQVAITYRPNLEAALVLIPRGVEIFQGPLTPNSNNKHKGAFLAFNLNLGLPTPCTTGYLPAQQRRAAAFEDWPDRPKDDLYCRIPQDAPFDVRGARNYPCETRPGKRAPTVAMCESDQEYQPLNDGYAWKGDPNGTLTGQDVPQVPLDAPAGAPPPAAPPPPPIAIAQYDPATGMYVGPDGRTYTQANLAQTSKEKSWQDMLTPPPG